MASGRTTVFPMRALLGLCVGFAGVAALGNLLPYDPTAPLPTEPPAGDLVLPPELARAPTAGELRIVCVGASETLGFPYPKELGFARLLGEGLRAALPTRAITTAGLGGTALDSPRIAAIARNALAAKPTLLVVVLGGNELSARVFAGKELVPDDWLGVVSDRLTRLRVMFDRAGRAGGGSVPDPATLLRKVSSARPAQPAVPGLPVGAADRRLLADRLARVMGEIAAAARAAQVPLVFAIAPHNLAGAWPHGMLARDTEIDREVGVWRRTGALAEFQHREGRADTLFVAGLGALARGEHAPAAELLARARDADPAPLHRTGLVAETIRARAVSLGARCLDLQQALLDARGVPDPARFLDALHPDAEGHAQIAAYLARELREELGGGDREAELTAAIRARLRALATPQTERDAHLQAGWSQALLHMLCGNFRDALVPLRANLHLLEKEPESQLTAKTLRDLGGYVLLAVCGEAGQLAAARDDAPHLLEELSRAVREGRSAAWIEARLSPR